MNSLATKAAFINIVLQPVVPYLALMTITKASFKNKSIATLLTLAYLIVVLYNIITERKDISCTKFSEDCNHLQYEWSPMKND